ncbi:SH3 domain-containing protein [Embleya sp. NPDC056575]|uniref:SH3 domain-containing protein n=1 Tax=unclassified Embleya TaxID=2699296 RepID=UPI0036A4B889
MSPVSRLLVRAGTAVVVVTLALAGTASAAPHHAPPTASAAHAPGHRAGVQCNVNDDNVTYRNGPGTEYKALGTVNQGQEFDVTGQNGEWYQGDLPGIASGVWINVGNVDC